jgi:hypothetical protein
MGSATSNTPLTHGSGLRNADNIADSGRNSTTNLTVESPPDHTSRFNLSINGCDHFNEDLPERVDQADANLALRTFPNPYPAHTQPSNFDITNELPFPCCDYVQADQLEWSPHTNNEEQYTYYGLESWAYIQ